MNPREVLYQRLYGVLGTLNEVEVLHVLPEDQKPRAFVKPIVEDTVYGAGEHEGGEFSRYKQATTVLGVRVGLTIQKDVNREGLLRQGLQAQSAEVARVVESGFDLKTYESGGFRIAEMSIALVAEIAQFVDGEASGEIYQSYLVRYAQKRL